MFEQQEKTFRSDVVILGGGPAGTATALSLRQHVPSLSLTIIEQSGYDAMRIGETLPPLAQPLLERLGVWDAFLEEGHMPAYGSCSAWGSDELWEHEFIYHPAGRGWHLDRKRFDAMLARAASAAGVTLYTGAKFIAARPSGPKRWRLTARTEQGEEISIETAFVVDATGRRAVFASRQGIGKVLLDQLLGVFVCFGTHGGGAPVADTYTLVEAWEEGWWYCASLPEEKIAVVCMSDADIVKKRRLNTASQWLELMSRTRHLKERVRGAEPLTAPAVNAAHSQRLERTTGEGWLAVGDAANTFDPLSSAGICKALRHGVMASYAIGDYFKGSVSSLKKYEAVVASEFEGYLSTRADFYGRERRWAHAPFWRRRHPRARVANE